MPPAAPPEPQQRGAKGTPSKPPRATEFQRTPLPLPRRSLCGYGSPLLGDRWPEGGTTPISQAASSPQLVSLTPHLGALHVASPQQGAGLSFTTGVASPLACSVPLTPHWAAPLAASPPGAQGVSFATGTSSPLACSALYGTGTPVSLPYLGQASTPSGCPGLPGLSPTNHGQVLSSHKLGFCSTPSNSLSSTVSLCTSTPSKIMTISTPLRPCSRTKAKEIQDDINQAVEEQSVPLLRAALLRRHPCRDNEHALHEAVRQAHVNAMKLLLPCHAEPNLRCSCLERGCQFPLQLAVTGAGFIRGTDRLQAVELLLRAGAWPSVRRSNTEANTPLHDAIRRGDFEVAALLLQHAADPNALNGYGETPLHLVLQQEGGFMNVALLRASCEVLLGAGASPLIADQRGLRPVEIVADEELSTMLQRWTAWWRCRTLAWVHSRGRHAFRQLMPELLLHVARFM